MRKAYVFALAFFNWNIGNVHSFPSPSHLSTTTAAISQHQRSYNAHLDSRQIRNADYSSKSPSPPGLNPELEAAYNSKAHPQTSQGISSASPTMESKDGKIKATRSIGVRGRYSNLERKYMLFLDDHNPENTTPSGVGKYNLGDKQRRRLAPGRPVDTSSPTGRLDSEKIYFTRAPRKIDGGWRKKRQETIHSINRPPSPFDDIARAPKVRRAEGEIPLLPQRQISHWFFKNFPAVRIPSAYRKPFSKMN
ncbi:hypothetical protein BDZ94DRAFT_1238211 [Collybia nuda]|uniref:Uncharacterized protein n=1 Tax=Collybia nuda TaxID=64659 RepID=A0A9P5Y3N2_9AGAR|nr:hypothetical protein BDZ94DRAFT_1238211 [Collybia nuda]